MILANEGHSQYWEWPSLATITQPSYSINSLLITHSWNCKYSSDKWSYYLYKKERFPCTGRHSLRYGGLVVKFVQFYKDPGEMHTCRNKSIRLWTCIFLPTNVLTSPLLTLLNHTSSFSYYLYDFQKSLWKLT